MARKLRIEYPGAIYHVTARGNKRGDIFLDDKDRRTLLRLLTETAERFGWLCAAYCLMDNHYHLLIKTVRATLSKGMHWLNGVYTQRFNKRHEQVGHLFQGRFGDSLVQDGRYLQAVSRYIVLNPVEARQVTSPEDWAWSSHRAILGTEQPLGCLEPELVLSGFGETTDSPRKEYEQFVFAGIGLNDEDAMNLPIIGDERFIETHQEIVGNRIENREFPIIQRFLARPPLDELFAGHNRNGTKAREIRNRNIFQAVDVFGYSQREVAEFLNLHYSGISNIIKKQKLNSKDAAPILRLKNQTLKTRPQRRDDEPSR